MELYYAIMNIVDYLALNKNTLNGKTRSNLIYILEDLLEMNGSTIEDIADANDCGECHTWDQLVNCIRELFDIGDRFPVR